MVVERVVLTDVGALRALADPMRLRMLLAMRDDARTVKDVAGEMGVPPTRLYYHVRLLAKHGLLRVARTRKVRGIEEHSYQATAKSLGVADHLMSSAIVQSGVLEAVFEMAAAELSLALERAAPVPVLLFTRLRLDPSRAKELQARIDEIVERFADDDADDGAGGHDGDGEAYHALFTVYAR